MCVHFSSTLLGQNVLEMKVPGAPCKSPFTLASSVQQPHVSHTHPSIGEFGSPGVSLLVHGGRLVAKRNTFFLDEQCGVAVEPLSGKATTVYLEGNTFDGGFR